MRYCQFQQNKVACENRLLTDGWKITLALYQPRTLLTKCYYLRPMKNLASL